MNLKISLILACGLLVGSVAASDISAYIANLNSLDYEIRQSARLDLRQTLVDSSGGKLRAYEKELIAAITSDQDFATRDWSIRMLELVGNSASVKPLSNLLNDRDPRIADLARRALSAITSSAADSALERATVTAPPAQQSGYSDSLAYRGKPRARNELDDLLFYGSSDAALALGKIGSRSSRAALLEAHATADGALKHDIELALLDAGLTDANLASTLTRNGQSPAIRVGAFDQLLQLNRRAAGQVLQEVLRDPTDLNRRVMLRKAIGTELAEDVVALLPNQNSAEQIVILGAIADGKRRQFEDAVLPLLGNVSTDVNDAVIETLGIIGSEASYPPLLNRYLGNPRDRTTEAALARLQAPEVDADLMATVNGSGSLSDRSAALQLLVLRNTDGVADVVNRLGQLGNPAEIRVAAFRGMEVIGNVKSIESLLQSVLSDDPEKRQAQGSLKKLSANLGVPDFLWQELYAPAIKSAESDQLRSDVLAILDGISCKGAADYLEELITKDHDLRTDALRSLQRWTHISGGNVWLAMARNANVGTKDKSSAQTGILRLLKSNRVSGDDQLRVNLAKEAILQFPNAEFQQSIIDLYMGRISRGVATQIRRQFPELVGHADVKVDVSALLKKLGD